MQSLHIACRLSRLCALSQVEVMEASIAEVVRSITPAEEGRLLVLPNLCVERLRAQGRHDDGHLSKSQELHRLERAQRAALRCKPALAFCRHGSLVLKVTSAALADHTACRLAVCLRLLSTGKR